MTDEHRAVMIAFTGPKSPDDEADFNRWYDEVHLREVLAVPGVVAAARYKIEDIPIAPGIARPTRPYLAIYELSARTPGDLERYVHALSSRMTGGAFDMSGPIDLAPNQAAMMLALPIGRRLVKES